MDKAGNCGCEFHIGYEGNSVTGTAIGGRREAKYSVEGDGRKELRKRTWGGHGAGRNIKQRFEPVVHEYIV